MSNPLRFKNPARCGTLQASAEARAQPHCQWLPGGHVLLIRSGRARVLGRRNARLRCTRPTERLHAALRQRRHEVAELDRLRVAEEAVLQQQQVVAAVLQAAGALPWVGGGRRDGSIAVPVGGGSRR